MLPDIMHANYLHEEYERRRKAERLVRLALKARAERTGAMAHPLVQLFRSVVRVATTLWHWGWRLIRHWSGQQDAKLSVPMKHQL